MKKDVQYDSMGKEHNLRPYVALSSQSQLQRLSLFFWRVKLIV
jgi:hypothetical protein